MENTKDGWNEWSKHVLKELERLNDNYEGLREELHKTHKEVHKMAGIKDSVEDLKDWKKEMCEVCSPKQLEEIKKDVNKLLAFKITAITVWLVIQAVFAGYISLFKP